MPVSINRKILIRTRISCPHDTFTHAGPQRNEAFSVAPGKKLFFWHRAAHATKPSGLSPGRRSKPVADCRRNDAGRPFKHMDPKMLHRCSKPAEICTLRRRAVPVRRPRVNHPHHWYRNHPGPNLVIFFLYALQVLPV